MNKKLSNKTALVTSASRGIGLACALKLAENGARVAMGVRRMEAAEELCGQYRDRGYDMFPVFFDALQQESYASMVDSVLTQAGHIDILVNNFGIGMPAEDLDLVKGSEEAFFRIVDLNLGSVYRICRLVVPHMVERGGGSIVNISSIGGLLPDVSRIGYGVSKAAINSITQQIAMQYARDGIRCNAVLPGLTATDAALRNMPEAFISSFLSHVPLNRMGAPEDIANAVLFLSSGDASYITGHILDVAGGYGIGTPQYADIIRGSLRQEAP